MVQQTDKFKKEHLLINPVPGCSQIGTAVEMCFCINFQGFIYFYCFIIIKEDKESLDQQNLEIKQFSEIYNCQG